RTRFIDDMVAEALQSGIRQMVVLGAGFDTRSHRIPGIGNCRVVEIDHPETSRLKQKLIHTKSTAPAHVWYLGVDFNTQTIGEVLQESGLEMERRVLFLWEGVTNYLSEESVDSTFSVIATAATGSQVLFTYVDRDVLRSDSKFENTGALRELLHQV